MNSTLNLKANACLQSFGKDVWAVFGLRGRNAGKNKWDVTLGTVKALCVLFFRIGAFWCSKTENHTNINCLTSFRSQAGNEQRALLSPGSTGSVNNQTSTSNTESCDTTPCSSDCDIVYQPIKNCESLEAGLILGEGGESDSVPHNLSNYNDDSTNGIDLEADKPIVKEIEEKCVNGNLDIESHLKQN